MNGHPMSRLARYRHPTNRLLTIGVRTATATVLAVILALAAVCAGSSCGCGGAETDGSTADGSPGAGGAPRPGGVYRFPLAADPVCIWPANARESEGCQVAHQVFQGLVKYEVQADGSLKTVPDIAESWTANDEATVFTFKLKRGVRFQPPVSREVRAQDFVACFDYVTDPANKSYVSYILAPLTGVDDGGYQTDPQRGLSGVEALDDYTLRFTLRYPFAEFPVTLGHTVAAVWPVDYLRKVGRKAFAEKPVGSGPYMVEEWVHHEHLDVVRNPDWWDEASGGPYVDRIHFAVMRNIYTQWLSFEDGDLDFSGVPPGEMSAVAEMKQVRGGLWTAKKYPVLAIGFVGIDLTRPGLGGDENLPLRRALSQAVDRAAAVRVVGQGLPQTATGLVPPGVPGGGGDELPYPYDPAEAREILTDLASVPEFEYWYPTDLQNQQTAEALQAGWQSVGLTVDLHNIEWGTFLDMLAQHGIDLFSAGWIADYPSIDAFLFPLYHSDLSPLGSGTSYSDPEVDRLLVEARGTTDESARVSLYRRAEEIILRDAPVIPVYFMRDFRVTDNRIGGFRYRPDGYIDMWRLWVR